MRVFVLVLAVLSTPALADPCKSDRAWLHKITPELQQLGEHSEDAALTCGVHGADDKMADKLAAEAKKVVKDLSTIPDGSCKLNPAGVTTRDLVLRVGKWTTDQIMAGVEMCSTKIRARAVELTKAGKDLAEIDKELHHMASDFMAEATK